MLINFFHFSFFLRHEFLAVSKHCVSNEFGDNFWMSQTSKHATLQLNILLKLITKFLQLYQKAMLLKKLLPNSSDRCRKWPYIAKKIRKYVLFQSITNLGAPFIWGAGHLHHLPCGKQVPGLIKCFCFSNIMCDYNLWKPKTDN